MNILYGLYEQMLRVKMKMPWRTNENHSNGTGFGKILRILYMIKADYTDIPQSTARLTAALWMSAFVFFSGKLKASEIQFGSIRPASVFILTPS